VGGGKKGGNEERDERRQRGSAGKRVWWGVTALPSRELGGQGRSKVMDELIVPLDKPVSKREKKNFPQIIRFRGIGSEV